jgi:YVTN family beta-propeller protein
MLPDSYVAVMNTATKTIIDSLDCGSGPEGIALFNNKIYVANSYETSVSVIDISSGNSSKIQLEAAPQHFALDQNLQLWVTVTSYYGTYPAEKVGLQAINTATSTKGDFIQVPGLSDDGLIASNGTGDKFYLLTAEPYPGTETNVLEFDATSKSLATDPLLLGENFYGIGYNSSTDKLYVSDAAGFAGNGKILVYEADGTLVDQQVASVGPFQFMFK